MDLLDMSSETTEWHLEAQHDQDPSPIKHNRVHDIVADAAFPIPVDDKFLSANELYDEGSQSDFLVIAKGHTYDLHKRVLGDASRYFKRMFEVSLMPVISLFSWSTKLMR